MLAAPKITSLERLERVVLAGKMIALPASFVEEEKVSGAEWWSLRRHQLGRKLMATSFGYESL